MSLDSVNTSGTTTGAAQNGRITVKANKNNHQYQNPPKGVKEYTLDNFDDVGPVLKDRIDEVNYYG